MGGIGLEPTTSCVSSNKTPPSKHTQIKTLCDDGDSACTDTCTENAETRENQIYDLPSDLADIIAVWSNLPDYIKNAIKALIQTHAKETK